MVAMTREQDRLWSYADVLALPEGTGERHEIIAGELFVSASPAAIHQGCLSEIAFILETHARPDDLGLVLSGPIDVYFSEHTVLVPDLLYLSNANLWRFSANRHAITGAPDLVVEIASRSTQRRDRLQKMAIYADAGVSEYWLPNPLAREFDPLVLENGHYRSIKLVHGTLASQVLPGLRINPAALFARLDTLHRRARASEPRASSEQV